DVTRLRVDNFGTRQTQVAKHLTDFAGTGLAIGTDDGDLLVGLDATTADTADADNTHVGVVIQLGDLHLESTSRVTLRLLDVVNDRLEQGFHVVGFNALVHGGPAVQC